MTGCHLCSVNFTPLLGKVHIEIFLYLCRQDSRNEDNLQHKRKNLAKLCFCTKSELLKRV